MSAILSNDFLNDFISPGVACIKPIETLPLQDPAASNPYEVTTEDRVAAQAPAQITLTDCLACSGCVTSAETVLVSLQSHSEVLSTLDSAPSFSTEELRRRSAAAMNTNSTPYAFERQDTRKIFVASVSPQVRANLAATYGTTEREAGWMIEQLLCGPQGISIGGRYANRFAWILDTNAMRNVCLAMEAEQVAKAESGEVTTKKPLLTSACPGWICYVEKTRPHAIPHLSPLKSPQALTGTLLKSVLAKQLQVDPGQIWHLALMPCFDKKLEAARQELTDAHWYDRSDSDMNQAPVRDVDCVITAREVLMLADARGISFPTLPRAPVDSTLQIPFPDPLIGAFVGRPVRNGDTSRGTSGGFLHHVLASQKARYPDSVIRSERGRHEDITEFTVSTGNKIYFRAARYYGFRSIQNLVRRKLPQPPSRLPGRQGGAARQMERKAKTEDKTYSYVEVMACGGGCTNGGGQIKLDDLSTLQASRRGIESAKEWLTLVDETYFSMDESDVSEGQVAESLRTRECGIQGSGEASNMVNGISHRNIEDLVIYWSQLTGITKEKLLYTTFRAVESDVGRKQGNESEQVAKLAGKAGEIF